MTKKWNCLYYGEILVVPMSDQKVESPILRRDCGGSEERPKSEIAYTTVRSWWLKKLNSLYYGEILVFPRGHYKVELPMLRRDPGGSARNVAEAGSGAAALGTNGRSCAIASGRPRNEGTQPRHTHKPLRALSNHIGVPPMDTPRNGAGSGCV